MFYLSLFASVLVGIGSSLGESTLLGFLKTFPSEAVGYYSSGTGFAGISGALILLSLSAAGLSNGAIFIAAMPSAIPYFLSFLWVDNKKRLFPYVAQLDESIEIVEKVSKPSSDPASVINARSEPISFTGANSGDSLVDRESNFVTAIQVNEEEANLAEVGVVDNEILNWANAKCVYKKVGLLITNLALVYFLEYLITTSFTVVSARRIVNLDPTRKKDFVYVNAYAIFNFCYQVGVFISRSSLSFFKI